MLCSVMAMPWYQIVTQTGASAVAAHLLGEPEYPFGAVLRHCHCPLIVSKLQGPYNAALLYLYSTLGYVLLLYSNSLQGPYNTELLYSALSLSTYIYILCVVVAMLYTNSTYNALPVLCSIQNL